MRAIRAAVVATLLAVAIVATGCSQLPSHRDGDVAAAPAEVAKPILLTRSWGVVDGMLSVVVVNTTDRTLSSAEGVITARDGNDVLVSSSLEDPSGGCCTVTDLPPGQQFGFYVDIGDAASDISRVDVAYRSVAWAPGGDDVANPLVAHPVRLDSNRQGAVVVADVKATGPMVAQASVQAFLTGPDGKFLAVVAGRWFCFSKGSHQIRMQLLHPVPAGTTVDKVVVHPLTGDADGTALHCAGPARAG